MGGIVGAVVLDRKKLGRNAFWRECKTATRASRSVEIRTSCKEWEELPLDIKLLYYLAERRGTVRSPGGYAGAVVGIPSIAKEILKLTVALAAIVLAIVFVSKKYKFTIEGGPDGTIKITGEPT